MHNSEESFRRLYNHVYGTQSSYDVRQSITQEIFSTKEECEVLVQQWESARYSDYFNNRSNLYKTFLNSITWPW